jgi:hypothetical protein
MKISHAIPVAAACLVMGGGTVAVAADQQAGVSAGSYGQGTAAAGKHGAVARGVVGSDASAKERLERRGHHRATRPQVNSATTYGTGAVYTDRRSGSAAVNTGGTASGSGVQATGSTVDAYSETTRDGSSADIYGDSVATSGERPGN